MNTGTTEVEEEGEKRGGEGEVGGGLPKGRGKIGKG